MRGSISASLAACGFHYCAIHGCFLCPTRLRFTRTVERHQAGDRVDVAVDRAVKARKGRTPRDKDLVVANTQRASLSMPRGGGCAYAGCGQQRLCRTDRSVPASISDGAVIDRPFQRRAAIHDVSLEDDGPEIIRRADAPGWIEFSSTGAMLLLTRRAKAVATFR